MAVKAQSTISLASVKTVNDASQYALQQAQEAKTSADNAERSAQSAQASANNASEYATRALGNLSTVQSVTETLNWITEHGTMTRTTDTAIDPSHVYFIEDAQGDYVVGSMHYSIVSEPKVADLSTYYELSIDESLNNYVSTHLAVTSEGLWIIPDAGGNRILIATGQGQTYTTAGTYIIGAGGVILASFKANGAQIGKTEESHAEIGKRYFKLIDLSNKEYVHFSDLRGDDGYYTNVETLVRNTQIAGRDGYQQILLMYPFTLLTVSWGNNSYEYPASQGYRLWNTSSGSDYSYSVRFLTPPANGDAIKIVYTLNGTETTKTITANGTDTEYPVETGSNISVRLKHVYIDDVEVLGVYYVSSHAFVQFTGELIPNEETVTLTYTTNSELTKAFTLGERKQDSKVGAMSFTVGSGTEASGNYSKATGRGCVASGTASEASGRDCTATGNYSHAEGWETTASGTASHAEGDGTQATDDYSHSEGGSTVASGWASHSEGWITNATGDYSHSEGNETTASGDGSHAEGYLSQATGRFSHAEGTETEAGGASSHASNLGTVAHYEAQTAIGKYNSNNADSAFEIGNGAEGAPSNAFRVDWNGNVEASGEVKGVVKAVGAITGQVLANTAVASGTTWTNLGSFTLPAGLWIVNIATNFSSNANGYRLLSLATSATSAGAINRTVRLPAVNGNLTAINLTAFCEGGTYYLNAVQNSGSSLTVSARYTALRLGNSVEYL